MPLCLPGGLFLFCDVCRHSSLLLPLTVIGTSVPNQVFTFCWWKKTVLQQTHFIPRTHAEMSVGVIYFGCWPSSPRLFTQHFYHSQRLTALPECCQNVQTGPYFVYLLSAPGWMVGGLSVLRLLIFTKAQWVVVHRKQEVDKQCASRREKGETNK